ncbi:MAG: hypothetical protein WCF68_01270 [Terriglobales bacterium]
MAKTAVGLFENPGSADGVVRELEASGFPRNDVRVLTEPREMAGSGVMSTPHTDFEVDLIRDLRAFGAAEADAEAYVRGVRRGGVMVFATGSGAMADTAAAIMNQHCAVEIEELSSVVAYLPGAGNGSDNSEIAPDRDVSSQAGRVRTSGSGARLFVW